ncbi:MAG: alpha/beta hydrolase [Marinicellaceae bacterium]
MLDLSFKTMLMKYLYSLIFVVFLSSCTKTGLNVINLISDSTEFEVIKDIHYGQHKINVLDLYLPTSQKPTATVIFFYGGCWGKCSDLAKNHYQFVAQSLTRQGFAVVIPDYRQFPVVNFNQIMDDAKSATQWTLNNILNYGATNNNVFLMGHSSGAHISAMLAVDEQHLGASLSSVKGVISLAGPYDFYPFVGEYMYDLFSEADEYKDSQPINFIDGNEPPFLLLQGDKDQKVQPENALNFSAKLTEKNVAHEIMLLDQKRHAAVLLNLAKPFRDDEKVLSSIYRFIDQYQ